MKMINRLVKMFELISPKLLLENYWIVLDQIIELNKERRFTLSEIRERISLKMQDFMFNPITYRTYLRSLSVIEPVINDLVNAGLLLQKNNTFIGTDEFCEFFYLLKNKIRVKVKERIAWALFYLYNSKGLNHFSICEVIEVLSFSDEEYIKELPYLVKWKDNRWLRLLEKRNDEWKLVELPCKYMKPILLGSINYRLHKSLFELLNTKDRFSVEEIIKTLRKLEEKSIEKFLKKFGLKQRDEEWIIDSESYKKVKRELIIAHISVNWPQFGKIVGHNPFFKLEGNANNAYVDMPNDLFNEFLEKLDFLSKRYRDSPEVLYKKAVEIKDEYNKIGKEMGGWFSFSLKRYVSPTKEFGIQMNIKWDLFQSFLENFVKKEIPLEEKYRYLYMCRSQITWMRRGPSKELEKRVKMFSEQDISSMRKILTIFIEKLQEIRKEYRRKLLLRRRIQPLFLAYLPEMILTFQTIEHSIQKGHISICYREMRKILESLSWVIIDDIMLYKRKWNYKKIDFIPPLRIPNKDWYNWARSKGLFLRNLSQLEKSRLIKEIAERYNIGKDKVFEVLVRNMSYPLFIALVGNDTHLPNRLKGIVPFYEIKAFESFIKENIRDIIALLVKSKWKIDEVYIDELTEKLLHNKSSVVIPYPSNSFIIQLLSKTSRLNLFNLYENYSYFVHSYDEAWQFYPFSSILEFKILRHELIQFIELLVKLIRFYEKCLSIRRRNNIFNLD